MDWNYDAPLIINSFRVGNVIKVQVSLRSLHVVVIVQSSVTLPCCPAM
jgi:hypothetical protein